MALRFYSEFSTERGNTWRVNVIDTDFSGTAEEFSCAAPGFVLSYFGGEDVFSPLMPSTCTVHMMVQTATQQTLINELADFAEGKYIIEVREDPDGTDQRHWLGMLTPESIRIPDQARPFAIELEAICGLATLSRQDFDDLLSLYSTSLFEGPTKSHMLNCLAAIPNQRDIFSTSEPYLRVGQDVQPVTDTATDTFISDVNFSAKTFNWDLGLREVGTCEDMLVQICIMLNARLFMYQGAWAFMPIAKVMSTVSLLQDVKNITKAGTVSSGSNIVTAVTFNQVNRHRLGGEFYYLPAVRKITQEINYFGNSPFAGGPRLDSNDFTVIGNTSTGLDQYNEITGSADTTFDSLKTIRVKGFASLRLPWSYTGLADVSNYDAASRLSRWRLEITVKCGNKYLQRNIPHDYSSTTYEVSELYNPPTTGNNTASIFNPGEPAQFSWTSDSASRVHYWSNVLVNGFYVPNLDNVDVLGVFDRIDFDFESPVLGSTQPATLEVKMELRGYNGTASANFPAAFLAGPEVYNRQEIDLIMAAAAYAGDGSDSGDVLTFGAQLSNGATEEMQVTTGIYAEATANGLFNFNSAALLDSSGASVQGFTSTNTTTTKALGSLICRDRLEHFGEQQEAYHGDFQSEIILNPFSAPNYLGKKWMITSMRHEASSDVYDLDLIAVKTLGTLDPDEVATDRRSIEQTYNPAGSITGIQDSTRKGVRDLSQEIADVNTDVANKFNTGLASLGDVDLTGLQNNQIIRYSSGSSTWKAVNESGGGGVTYHDRYSTEAESLRSGAAANVELYYTARPDGDGLAESATSDSGVTDTINRTLYFSAKHEADPDTAADWTEYTTQPADNATFATAKAALLAGLNETDGTANTRGTLPLSLKIVRTTTAATTLLLNDYPGAAAAYSVRKLDVNYTGSCMRIREASGNTETDIGFDANGDLDTAAIAAHCGNREGFITVWYDQANIGGTAKNQTQSTSSKQPKIYNGSAVITDSGKPAIDFDGGADGLNCSTNLRTSTGASTVVQVRNVPRGGNYQQPFCFNKVQRHVIDKSGESAYEEIAISTNETSREYLRFAAADVSSRVLHFSAWDGSTQVGGVDEVELHENGGQENSTVGTSGFAVVGTGSNSIGYRNNNTQYCNGTFQEVLVWLTDESSDRSGIESDINAYFSIY